MTATATAPQILRVQGQQDGQVHLADGVHAVFYGKPFPACRSWRFAPMSHTYATANGAELTCVDCCERQEVNERRERTRSW